MEKIIRVGSRESKLALAQTELVLKEIKKFHPEMQFELVPMKTTGDKILDRNLDQIGGKGLFVKELDRALLERKVDLTIHSLKDLPMEIPDELPILGYSKREDPRDAMICGQKLKSYLDEKAGEDGEKEKALSEEEKLCIGTSSKRREKQLSILYPKADFRGIRGNVQTRLRKLEEEGYDATVLAMAGLKRLGVEEIADQIFSVDEVIPAAGQGILVLQGRRGEEYFFLDEVCDREAAYAATAERSFVKTLDGGCTSPAAAYAELAGNQLLLRGLYYDEETEGFLTGKKSLLLAEGALAEAEKLGKELALELKEKYQAKLKEKNCEA
jgi:hydroxymethylbilane synthase